MKRNIVLDALHEERNLLHSSNPSYIIVSAKFYDDMINELITDKNDIGFSEILKNPNESIFLFGINLIRSFDLKKDFVICYSLRG